jgi:prepilin-type N-terminal cleavage/methylation domain-containing protein
MHRKRTAFTLIELLVVIAIIAILAAILFPVFAQAKKAAKGAASLSNVKQLSLGVLMYTNDYDDDYPPTDVYCIPDAPYSFGDACGGFETWSYITVPYTKNGQIYMDPLKGDTNGFNPPGDLTVWEQMNPQYGYNWCLLNGCANNYVSNPAAGSVGGKVPGTESTTWISRPGDMVMLTTNTDHADPGYGIFVYNGALTLGTVEGPYCNYNISQCNDISNDWGVDNGWANINPDFPDGAPGFIEGGDTSGVALRATPENAEVSFCDGHAKSMSAGALAIGTTWSPTATKSQVKLTANGASVYRWWQY